MIPARVRCKSCDRTTDFLTCHSYETELICPDCYGMVLKAAQIWGQRWRGNAWANMMAYMFPGYVH